MRDDTLAGWVVLHRDTNPLVAHWGSIKHLQTHPTHRRKGLGAALMHELRRIARDELGLEQLHLAVRGGMGLENFYAQLGWHEVGRWPNALRLTADDTRDEVLMALAPL
jgi:GNAT superfamily N-acetyltransferase